MTVHLENEHIIYFNPEAIEDNPNGASDTPKCNSTLLPFFELCKIDEFARSLMYVDVGIHFTWKNSTFTRRKTKQYQIKRVYLVHPRETEKLYLRMLLHKVRGPTSFEFLRTVNSIVCETFQKACQELGLLETDNHWDMALKEATDLSHPQQIRELFAVILTSGVPSNPNELWITHRESMSEDLLDLSIEEVYTHSIFNRALIIIEDKCIEMSNMRLKDLNMPSPDRTTSFEASNLRPPDRSTINIQKSTLNNDQKAVYRKIMDKIHSNSGGIIFLDAPGGTRKTFLINLIISEVQLNGGNAMAVASSGNLFIWNKQFYISLYNYKFYRYCSYSFGRWANGPFCF